MVMSITALRRMVFYSKRAIVLDESIACIAPAICCVVAVTGVLRYTRVSSKGLQQAECPHLKRVSSGIKKAFE